ncbi:hypothetical protein BCF46_2274 [Litoreibacter meonggei]|uniref:Uncharacterized protein n=1 Tax=Litoreibacter meonggei TaxID=1049199 RepID=A0A497WLK0_9RHOB|nr:hypothetical protein [Litoreibacter meonggei]RLJ52046.1 hypothetical protein BCF46_2274 [Litoreibacter meonggei]
MRLRFLLLLIPLGISACGDDPLASFIGGGSSKALSEITVTSDRVVLRGPTGFCVDPKSSQHGPSQAFVVFGNCAAISGNDEQPQPFVNAIATASVLPSRQNSPAIGESEVALAEFFASTSGKAVLSADGNADSVEILDSFSRNGAFFVHARDKSAPVLPGTTNTYWRGYFDVKNSVVALSVLGLKNAPVGSADGLQTLYDFGNALMEGQASRTKGAATQASGDVAKTGLLRRLFG